MTDLRADRAVRWEIGGESLSDVVAGNVVRIRHRRGWTRAQFCERLGAVLGRPVSQALLSQWEQCRAPMRLDVVAAVAHVFGCSLAVLLRTSPGSRLPPVCCAGVARCRTHRLMRCSTSCAAATTSKQ